MDKRYLVHNDWTGKYYLVNDRKSAVKLGNKMIEDWKVELCGEDYNPKNYDFECLGSIRQNTFQMSVEVCILCHLDEIIS